MFLTEMVESKTGRVCLDDMSAKTLEVLLKYISTGSLHQNWKSDDVILELTYAAHKYELVVLTDFLDNVLGSICSKTNALKLSLLANKLGMKKAEMDCLQYFKFNVENFDGIMLNALNADLTEVAPYKRRRLEKK